MPSASPIAANSVTPKKLPFVKSVWLAFLIAASRQSVFMGTMDPATIAGLCWMPVAYLQ